jgi:hypothetical protein
MKPKKASEKNAASGAQTAKALLAQPGDLLGILKARFERNMQRHPKVAWAEVAGRLEGNAANLRALSEMERTGGEPDVVSLQGKAGELVFVDCTAESPEGRRSVCYDRPALDSRKEHKPKTSAMEMAAAMGIELLTEEEYRALQAVGEFDLKTSSWVKAPGAIRELDGGIFCDRRYGRVFVYHTGPQSYYASRGFRGKLAV